MKNMGGRTGTAATYFQALSSPVAFLNVQLPPFTRVGSQVLIPVAPTRLAPLVAGIGFVFQPRRAETVIFLFSYITSPVQGRASDRESLSAFADPGWWRSAR